MKPSARCEQLESYLDGDLSAAESAVFQSHLSSCDDCQSAIGQQQWIDDLLRSPPLAALEPAPTRVLANMAAQVRRQRKRRMTLATSGLAAAVLAALMYLGIVKQPPGPVPVAATQAESIPSMQANLSPAIFMAGDDSIAVPVASEYPDVTIVRVYAAYRPAAAASSEMDIPADTKADGSIEFLNGG